MGYPKTPIVDTFDGTDDPSPMAGWSNIGSVSGISRVSNVAVGDANGNNLAYASTFGLTGDSYEAYITISTKGTSGTIAGVMAGVKDVSAGNTFDGYVASVAQTVFRLSRIDNGAETLLYSHSVTPVAGNKVGLRRYGGQLELWINTGSGWSRVQTVVDTTHPLGGYLGLVTTHTSWAMNDIGGGTLTFPFRSIGRGVLLGVGRGVR